MVLKKQSVLPLEIEIEPSYADGFVVSLCNLEAYRAVTNPTLWPNNRLLILGEEGSGKTTLAKIWAKECDATLFTQPFEQLYEESPHAVLAENAEEVPENELFHLINYCTQERINLLITARTLPSSCLKDLQSRIAATNKVLIKNPDDELVGVLLKKYFIENQIHVEPEVFEYVGSRIDRSFAAINNFLKQVNSSSLEQKRAITIPFVKNILRINDL